jgi:hypothetical protein
MICWQERRRVDDIKLLDHQQDESLEYFQNQQEGFAALERIVVSQVHL